MLTSEERNLLRHARDYLAQGPEYWTQGHATRGAARCSLGAIHFGSNFELTEIVKADHALTYFANVIGSRAGYVASWNDAPERTWEEVVAAFSKAVKLADTEAELIEAPTYTMPVKESVLA